MAGSQSRSGQVSGQPRQPRDDNDDDYLKNPMVLIVY